MEADATVPSGEATSAPVGATSEAPRRKLVVDTGAYNRSRYLDTSGDELYAPRGILKEIERFKDANPVGSHIRTVFTLNEREPTEDDVATVRRFASQTGDLPYLSVNDIRCIALTLRLQLESGDTACLRSEPLPLSFTGHRKGTGTSAPGSSPGADKVADKKGGKGKSKHWSGPASVGFDKWITPKNVHSYNISTSDRASDKRVACMTTDFAMQNVLLHMGLSVITLDGFAAKSVRSWGHLCRACHQTFPNTLRQFCDSCGNATVDRVPIVVDGETGQVIVKDTRRWINTRGTIYTQPKPVTGKSKQMYIVSEDQLLMPRYRNQLRSMNRKAAGDGMLHFGTEESAVGAGLSTATKALPALARVPVGLGRGNPNSNKWMQKHKRLLKE